jgi:hypothetical protein
MKFAFLITVLSSLLTITACSRGVTTPPMPENAPMGWQMKSIDVMGARGPCKQIWRVEYAGPGIVHVDVCATPSDATGLELTQTWKARANTVTFFNNRYFVTVNWDEGEKPALTALITKLETSLKVN